jgi:hypothetical protein
LNLGPHEKTVQNNSITMGFVTIEKLDGGQQVKLGIELFKQLLEAVVKLEDLGFDELVLTVEKDAPIIIGSFHAGLALAPRIKKDESFER